jgi:hypothetical protein
MTQILFFLVLTAIIYKVLTKIKE